MLFILDMIVWMIQSVPWKRVARGLEKKGRIFSPRMERICTDNRRDEVLKLLG
jgi:hypothetical protein